MSTSAPSVVAIGDFRKISLVTYSSSIYTVGLLASEQIALHKDGDASSLIRKLPFRIAGATDDITATVVGDLLYLSWSAGRVLFWARWNLAINTVDLDVQILGFAGSAPSIQTFAAPQVLMHYVDENDDHKSRITNDGGVSWSAAADPGNPHKVDFVDVSVSPLSPYDAAWASNVPATTFIERFDALDGWEPDLIAPPTPDNYWAWDQADLSGVTVADRGATPVPGTLVGGAVLDVANYRSSDAALLLNGAPQAMTVGSAFDFNGIDFTVGGWYRPSINGGPTTRIAGNRPSTGGNGWYVRMFSYFGNNNSFGFRLESGGQVLEVSQGIRQGPGDGLSGSGLAQDILYTFTSWTFWAMTWESATGHLLIYVTRQGGGPILRIDETRPALIGANFSNAAASVIGARSTGGAGLDTPFTGQIDDMFVYRGSVLDQGEIAYLQNETQRGRLIA